MTTDASGNIFVVGSFGGQITFGTTTLSTKGNSEIFIAKYLPATATWAWAVRGGGTGYDYGSGIAVRGNNVYVTGSIQNSSTNSDGVSFESAGTTSGTVLVPVLGSSSTSSLDLFVAKYTDNGTSATLGWTQVGGGLGRDGGAAIAASGSSVYVTGLLVNDRVNTNQVVFGGTGTTLGAAVQAGASTVLTTDILVAKYTDNGSSAVLGWTQIAGGTSGDYGSGIAVSGPSVYVTGALANTLTNSRAVVFGGSGTTAGTAVQYGASSTSASDLFVAKYTDNGSSATLGWTQVAGGTGFDEGYGIAASGASVYVTGYITNSQTNGGVVVLGGAGATPGTSQQLGATPTNSADLFVAKYTDNGPNTTLSWTQVGGGTDYDAGYALALSGTSLYVTGYTTNNTANSKAVVFGGGGAAVGTSPQPGASATTSPDVVVAKYALTGTSPLLNWTQIAGGTDQDQGQSIAVVGTSLYVAGSLVPGAIFGSLAITTPSSGYLGFLGGFANAALVAMPAVASASPSLYPNPAPGPATLNGTAAGATVLVLDALGRRVATATANASGTATLPGGLPAGLYLVRAGTVTLRWGVE